jgi:RNA polymerase sigma factor (sigma-70 family)
VLGLVVTEGARVAGDGDLFLNLLADRLDDAYQLAGYLLGDADEARDAAQEASARAWAKFDSLRDRTAFEPWFRRILVNECRDRLRRRGRVRFVRLERDDRSDDAPDDPSADDPFASTLARDALGRALGVLDPEERAVVVLHYWHDLTTAEIADTLGMRQGTVKFRLHSAYGAMRRQLQRSAQEARR